MKSLNVVGLLFLIGVLAGCTSTEETVSPNVIVNAPTSGTMTAGTTSGTSTSGMSTTDLTGYTLLSQGLFMNGVHAVSGTVKVYEKAGKRSLVFTNFSTDGGPDLRIYMAENTGLRNFIELTRLNSTGSFSVELPAEADPGRQRHVIIWCKAFSVLFGSAELK